MFHWSGIFNKTGMLVDNRITMFCDSPTVYWWPVNGYSNLEQNVQKLGIWIAFVLAKLYCSIQLTPPMLSCYGK